MLSGNELFLMLVKKIKLVLNFKSFFTYDWMNGKNEYSIILIHISSIVCTKHHRKNFFDKQ